VTFKPPQSSPVFSSFGIAPLNGDLSPFGFFSLTLLPLEFFLLDAASPCSHLDVLFRVVVVGLSVCAPLGGQTGRLLSCAPATPSSRAGRRRSRWCWSPTLGLVFQGPASPSTQHRAYQHVVGAPTAGRRAAARRGRPVAGHGNLGRGGRRRHCIVARSGGPPVLGPPGRTVRGAWLVFRTRLHRGWSARLALPVSRVGIPWCGSCSHALRR